VSEKDAGERARELLVYGPIGLALYVRDTAPSFLKLFVARGRAELDQRRKSVGDQLGQARAVGEVASGYGGSQAFQLLSGGLAMVRARAEETLGALGVLSADDLSAMSSERRDAPAGASAPPTTAPAVTVSGLAISDYDGLSASQVVDRLDGLSRADLDAIRVHESANRGRKTVLGKIDQLTRDQ
jgi:hypothetical protein